MRRIRSM